MARNGAGTYSLPAGNPVTTGTTISSSWANNTLSDIATTLTSSLAYDGQTNPVANLPMAGYIHTNVGVASNRNNYAQAGQVQDGTYSTLTSVSGTDTITATAAINLTTYAAGQTFNFVSVGANTTGTVTLNINGIGAKNITKNGATPLSAGDISSGQMISVIYDGTQFQLQTAALGVTAFSAGTTGLTPSSLTKGSVTLGGVLGKLNGGTGALTASITFVSRTSNVSTITTSSAHGFAVGDYVNVAAVINTAFNGYFTITTVGTTTFTYAQVAGDISTTADTGTAINLSYVNLAQNVTGILYPNYGGTGTTTLNTGALVIGNATSAVTTVSPTSPGQALVVTSGSSVNAGSFVIGATYTITSVGSTSFTSIGAASNTVGVSFTATGVGSGSGTATLNTWASGSSVISSTVQTTTSGTSKDFTNIPSWVKRITVMFNGVSTNGATNPMIQLGTGSTPTYTNTGYAGAISNSSGSSTAFSTGFLITQAFAATNIFVGTMTLVNITGNTWVESSSVGLTDSVTNRYGAGSIALGGALTAVRLTTVNGTDVFDAGSVNILYE